VQTESAVDISEEIDQLSKKSQQLTKDIYSQPDALAGDQDRAPQHRPYTLDYVNEVFTDFQELHGDRHFSDDLSIVGGLARFNGQPCMVLGHQKGRDTKERTLRNFGMTRPEGYRKALRLMKLAEKFRLPVFTFVDTPGAYPGIDAEERGQSEAIGRNIFEMAQLEVPIISHHHRRRRLGRRAGHRVADQVLMLQYSVYSVISPKAAPPSCGRPATAPATPPRPWASPRTGSRRWAWSTRSSTSRWAARTATTSRWPPSSSAP
jgi:acetyl-CoA carboxylase carboxyl transferase subunit alpha